MTTTSSDASSAAPTELPEAPAQPAATSQHPPVRRGWAAAVVPLGVCAVVALLAQVPLWRNETFYFTDDSAAQFLPMWHRIGEQLLAGNWPPLLDLDSWMGGNLAAEALFGVWNPVNLLDYLMVASIGDLAVAATVVKTQFLVMLALGTYLLCREYGAARWASSALAVALPFGGFTLYFQASTWAAGLMAFAWVPFVWWSARRAARGELAAIWAFVFGALCVTAGNPYGLLGVCMVFLGLLVEFWLGRDKAGVRRVLLVGATVAAVVPLVFLPLLGNSSVSWRANTEMFNIGQLVPRLTDLLNLSMPSHIPGIMSFAEGTVRMQTPVTYFAWFVLPLLAWLNWSALRTRLRALSGPLVVAGGYLLLSLAPSNMWMFRWPLRHVESLFLALAVVTAVALSAGLRTDHFRRRVLATGAVLALGGYLSFAAWPKISLRHLAAVALLTGLTVLCVLVARYGRAWTGRLLALTTVGGTALVLVVQTGWYPMNRDVAQYNFPTSIAQLESRFADRYQGTTVIVADRGPVLARGASPDGAWRDVLFGNMYAAADVTTLSSYTGMGHRGIHKALCLTFYGGMCAEAYGRLFEPSEAGGAPLADLLRVKTVAVLRAYVDAPKVPAGWKIVDRNDTITVLRRERELSWPAGRLGFATPGVQITEDGIAGDRNERLRFQRPAGSKAQLVFARLNWPGYTATVDGKPVPVRDGPAGLVAVDLPDGVGSGELRLNWTPKGFTLGVGLFAVGLLGAVALTVVPLLRRRRARAAQA